MDLCVFGCAAGRLFHRRGPGWPARGRRRGADRVVCGRCSVQRPLVGTGRPIPLAVVLGPFCMVVYLRLGLVAVPSGGAAVRGLERWLLVRCLRVCAGSGPVVCSAALGRVRVAALRAGRGRFRLRWYCHSSWVCSLEASQRCCMRKREPAVLARIVRGQGLLRPCRLALAHTHTSSTHPHTHTHNHTHRHTRVRTHTRACAHTHTRAYTHVLVHTHTHTHNHTHMHTHTHAP